MWNSVFFKICKYAFIAILCLATLKLYKAYRVERGRAETFVQTISDMGQKISSYKVALDDSTEVFAARVFDLNMTIENLKAYNGELLKKMNVRPKDVDNMTSAVTMVHDTIYVKAERDSFDGIHASHKDGYVSIDISISKWLECSINYEVMDSIVIVNEQKRHSILFGLIKWNGKRNTVIMSRNPKTTILDITTINVVQ